LADDPRVSQVESGRHFSGTTMGPLFERVRDCLGEQGIERLRRLAGDERPLAELFDVDGWSTYAQARALLEAGAVLLADHGGLESVGCSPMLASTSKPEVVAAITRFGTPEAMIAARNPAAAAVYPLLTFDAEVLAEGHARYRWALPEGYEPFPELCAFLRGMVPVMVRLFGRRVIEVRAGACQCWGDPVCEHEVRWDDGADLTTRLEAAETKLRIAELRLEGYQRTVEDLVSAPDLESVLRRIVHTAASSTQAVGFVLAVDVGGDERLFTQGLTEREARALLDDGLGSSVEVASSTRRYGRIAAVASADKFGFEQSLLQSFARLAATALDSAYAIEEARRQAAAAETLLSLSRSLTELSTVQEIASKVAEAIPAIIDCDCAFVALETVEGSQLLACTGFDEKTTAELLARPYEVHDRADDGVWFHVRESGNADLASGADAVTFDALAASHVRLEGGQIALIASVMQGRQRLLDDPRLPERLEGLASQAAVAVRNAQLLEQIRHQSLHDPLTGLPNRTLVNDRAEQMLHRARRSGAPIAALFIDLDGFKEINDTLGHAAGDQLLAQVARRLARAVRTSDTVGRLGGDEFVVLAEGASLEEGVEVVAGRILDVLRVPFQLPERDRPLTVTASIGAAVGDRASAVELLRDADIALYDAKAAGKSCARVFEPAMADDVRQRTELLDDLVSALAREEFLLLYQPVLSLGSETVDGVEALLRWEHPERGRLGPDAFIPLLEQSGLIVDVGRWVLVEACRQAAAWRAAGLSLEMSVNASARQLDRFDFIDDVREALEESGLPASSLVIEITETAIMEDTDAAIIVLAALREMGVRMAIDDFGTGYCSLAYLSQFPVDALKIDQVFVQSTERTASGPKMIHALVQLGEALGLDTYAEGIETQEQLDLLLAEGCSRGQGYLFARPLPAADLPSALATIAARVARTR
jgi:diguanylate cyclase (GGDEF)-like protein